MIIQKIPPYMLPLLAWFTFLDFPLSLSLLIQARKGFMQVLYVVLCGILVQDMKWYHGM